MAFVMDHCFGYKLPKLMQQEFAEVVQKISEVKGEVQPNEILEAFKNEYLELQEPFKLINIAISDVDHGVNETTKVKARIKYNDVEMDIEGVGNGPIDSLGKALYNSNLINISIMDYKEHALSKGSEAEAAAYVYMKRNDIEKKTFGVGVDSNITRASIKSIISAINRLYKLNS